MVKNIPKTYYKTVKYFYTFNIKTYFYKNLLFLFINTVWMDLVLFWGSPIKTTPANFTKMSENEV